MKEESKELILLREKLLERTEDWKVECVMCAHPAIINRMEECNSIIEMIQDRIREISPEDCDW